MHQQKTKQQEDIITERMFHSTSSITQRYPKGEFMPLQLISMGKTATNIQQY